MIKTFTTSLFLVALCITSACNPTTKSKSMILNVSGKTIESPTASDIQQAISNLQDNADSFVILSLSEMTYLQCIGDSSVGYIVEYQEGSKDQHFTTKDGHIDASTTLTIFKMYADQNPDWKNQTSWKKMSW